VPTGRTGRLGTLIVLRREEGLSDESQNLSYHCSPRNLSGRVFKNTYIIIKYGIFDNKFYTIHTIHTCPKVF